MLQHQESKKHTKHMHLNWKNFEMLQEHMVLKQHLDLHACPSARGAKSLVFRCLCGARERMKRLAPSCHFLMDKNDMTTKNADSSRVSLARLMFADVHGEDHLSSYEEIPFTTTNAAISTALRLGITVLVNLRIENAKQREIKHQSCGKAKSQ